MLKKVQLLEMLQLQDAFNTKVATKKGIPDWKMSGWDYLRAVRSECYESIQHISNWEWWKAPNDAPVDQIRLELIDIWHFALSHYMQIRPVIDYEGIGGQISSIVTLVDKCEVGQDPTELFEYIIKNSFVGIFDMASFCVLLKTYDLDWDRVYKLYIGKNVLNSFRQDHGYKEKTYVKIWDGREDNEVLTDILEKIDLGEEVITWKDGDQVKTIPNDGTSFRTSLYETLEYRYQQVCSV